MRSCAFLKPCEKPLEAIHTLIGILVLKLKALHTPITHQAHGAQRSHIGNLVLGALNPHIGILVPGVVHIPFGNLVLGS